MEAEAEAEAADFSKLEAEAEAEAMKKLPLPDTLQTTVRHQIGELYLAKILQSLAPNSILWLWD